jgi:hypothetical protein
MANGTAVPSAIVIVPDVSAPAAGTEGVEDLLLRLLFPVDDVLGFADVTCEWARTWEWGLSVWWL